MISTVLNPAARRLSATQRAPRSISGLCSLLALTLGIRKNSHSSARCASRRPSINSARLIGDPQGARSPFQKMNSDHLAMKRGGSLIAEVRMKSRGRHDLFYDCSLAQHKRRRYEKRIECTDSLNLRVADDAGAIASWLESHS